MRVNFYYIIFILSCWSCKASPQNHDTSTQQSKLKVETSDQKIEVQPIQEDLSGGIDLGSFMLYTNAETDDFKLSGLNKSDTITITKIMYRDLSNAIIIAKEGVKIAEVKETVTFDCTQYTIDDNPASPIGTNITIPYISKNPSRYQLVTADDHLDQIKNHHFEEIKSKSIQFQTDFYSNLLENKENYTKCCPEYIKQAEIFINKDKESFSTFDELKAFPFVKQRMISVTTIKEKEVTVKHIRYFSKSE